MKGAHVPLEKGQSSKEAAERFLSDKGRTPKKKEDPRSKYSLRFGDTQVARNGHTYQMSKVTDAFWEAWKKDKEGMKEAGFSPFKRNGEWFVAHYDGKTAGDEEKKSFEKKKLDFIKKTVASDLFGQDHPDAEKAAYEVEKAKDIEDLNVILEYYVRNPNQYLSSAEESWLTDYFGRSREKQSDEKAL